MNRDATEPESGPAFKGWWLPVCAAIVVIALLAIGLIVHFAKRPAVRPHQPTTQGVRSRQPPAQDVLRNGRLADLPPTASGVKTAGWAGIFTGEDFLMFRAAPEDIEKFVAESPSICNSKPEAFDSSHMHLPYPEDGEEQGRDHTYYRRHKWTPPWYAPTIREKGRTWTSPPHKHHNGGSVIVDDETHTVYIKVIWS